MSSNLIKASFVCAIIMMMAAFTITVSAQTPGAVNSLSAKPDSAREAKDNDVEKTSALAKEVSKQTSGPNDELANNPHLRVSDPVRGNARRSAAEKDEEREVNNKSDSASPQTTSTDGWQFQITPYFWIPTISGQAGIGDLTTDTSVSVGDSDVELNFAFMGTFEARKDRLIILTDLVYADIAVESDNRGPLFSSTRSSFKAFVLDPEIGYRLLDNGNGSTLDVLGGIRYWHLNATLDFRAGILPATQASRSRSWVDGIVGIRGKAALSQRFFVTGKADLGGGGSEFTYQLFGGVGVNLGQRFALIGGYRDLNVNYDKDGFLFDMSLHGPIIGLGIKF